MPGALEAVQLLMAESGLIQSGRTGGVAARQLGHQLIGDLVVGGALLGLHLLAHLHAEVAQAPAAAPARCEASVLARRQRETPASMATSATNELEQQDWGTSLPHRGVACRLMAAHNSAKSETSAAPVKRTCDPAAVWEWTARWYRHACGTASVHTVIRATEMLVLAQPTCDAAAVWAWIGRWCRRCWAG